jgi:hypothetical protein
MALIYFFHSTLQSVADRRKAAISSKVSSSTGASSSSSSLSSSSTSSTSTSCINYGVPLTYTSMRPGLPEATQRAHVAVSSWMPQFISLVIKYGLRTVGSNNFGDGDDQITSRTLPLLGCFFDWLRVNPQLVSMSREMTDNERMAW